jgi:hypothetical protein
MKVTHIIIMAAAVVVAPSKEPAGPRCGTSHHARHWCLHDACGWFCAIITWSLLGFVRLPFHVVVCFLTPPTQATYTTNFALVVPFIGLTMIGKVHIVIFNSLILLAYWSHLRAMLTNPGAVPKDALPVDYYESGGGHLQQSDNMCRRCQAYKPPRAHHCSTCQRCVVRMDHHCPWINNCVGAANHKFFLLFCMYVMLASFYANALLVYRVFHCVRKQTMARNGTLAQPSYCDATPGPFVMMVFLAIEALLFGLFTMCMLCDQYGTVFSSMTQIERLKAENGGGGSLGGGGHKTRSTVELLSEVFGGESFSFWWLLPVKATWKSHEKVFQYVFPRETEDMRDLEAGADDELESAHQQDEHGGGRRRVTVI